MSRFSSNARDQAVDQTIDRASILKNLRSPVSSYRDENWNNENKISKRNGQSFYESNSSKTAKSEESKESQTPKTSQESDLYAVRLLEKVLRGKNEHTERISLKRDIPSRARNILTEKHMNIDHDKASVSSPMNSPDAKESQHQQAFWPKKINSTTKKANNENKPALPVKRDPLTDIMNRKKLQKYSISQLLYISASCIDFGAKMPGQIVDESLEILNKSNQDLIVSITLDCERPEFRETEEYVYSIRRSHLLDFNDKHYLVMSPYSSASFKVTFKVPNVKKSSSNNGSINISIQGVKEASRISLESKIVVPKIACPKALYHSPSGCSIIKLAVRGGKKNEYKIPIQNQSNVPITVDFLFHSQTYAVQEDEIDLTMYPGTLLMSANESAFLVFSAKISRSEDSCSRRDKTVLKKVLLAKVRNTNLMYSFPVCIEAY